MSGWRDNELRQDRFTGRDDDRCVEYDRDWRHLLESEVISDFARNELERVLATKFLSETETRMIKHVLGDKEDD